MTFENYLNKLVQADLDAGFTNEQWWDESRIPLDSIDKTVAELLSLKGKKAVIMGGAGVNLGQACANRLAGLGADVAIVDLDPAVAQESGRMRWASPPDAAGLAAKLTERWGVEAHAVHGNVFEWDDIVRVLAESNELLGGIDILVNNAAGAMMGPFPTLPKEGIDVTVLGSMVGPIYAVRAVLDHMIPRGGGRIVNIGSESANTAMPGMVMYGAAKRGLMQFTRFVSMELAPYNIAINGVNAGSMWGPNRPFGQPVVNGVYAAGRTAIQRYELPEEVANMVAFLASPAASAMTGEMVNMGGGMGV